MTVTGTTAFAVGSGGGPGPVGAGVMEVFASIYPGSGEDLVLKTGVGGFATVEPPIKLAESGDVLVLSLASPGESLQFYPPVLLAQVFAGSIPVGPTLFPEVHVSLFSSALMSPIIVLYDPSTPAIGFGALPPGGMSLAFQVPIGLVGFRILLQGLVLDDQAQNGFFAATDAHELRVL